MSPLIARFALREDVAWRGRPLRAQPSSSPGRGDATGRRVTRDAAKATGIKRLSKGTSSFRASRGPGPFLEGPIRFFAAVSSAWIGGAVRRRPGLPHEPRVASEGASPDLLPRSGQRRHGRDRPRAGWQLGHFLPARAADGLCPLLRPVRDRRRADPAARDEETDPRRRHRLKAPRSVQRHPPIGRAASGEKEARYRIIFNRAGCRRGGVPINPPHPEVPPPSGGLEGAFRHWSCFRSFPCYGHESGLSIVPLIENV